MNNKKAGRERKRLEQNQTKRSREKSVDIESFQPASEKVNKANSLVGIIRRSFSHLDSATFVKIFIAFVRPHLDF